MKTTTIKDRFMNSSSKAKIAVFLITALALSGGVYAAVLIGQVNVTAPVEESLSITSSTDVNLVSVNPNEDHDVAVDIDNIATAENKALLTFTEDSNPDGVTYALTYDTNPLLIAGSSSGTVTATFHIESDSPIGTVAGHFTVERVAV